MSVKKATPAKKTTKVKAVTPKVKKLKPIADLLEAQAEEGEEEGGGKIQQILALYIKGYSKKEIREAGFNKSTVYIQCGQYDKLKRAPATSYMSFPIFEGRVQRIMQAKKCTRDKAVEIIHAKDLEG